MDDIDIRKEKLFYRGKSLSVASDVELTEEEKANEDILLYFVMDIATSHKDRGGDVLTKEFLQDGAKDLSHNTSFFKNHNTREDPIGVIKQSSYNQLSDGNSSIRIKVGLTNIEENIKIAKLIRSGAYSKGSIGFYLKEWEYDEKSDTFFIKEGEIVEASLVGVPMNGQAGMVESSKQKLYEFKKSLRDDLNNKVLNNKDVEDSNMAEKELTEQMKEMFSSFKKDMDERFENIESKFDSNPEPEPEPELSEFEKELKTYKEKMEKIEEENKKMREALSGRKTGGSGGSYDTKDVDPYGFDLKGDHVQFDDKFKKYNSKALNIGYYAMGKALTEGHEVELVASSDDDTISENIAKSLGIERLLGV